MFSDLPVRGICSESTRCKVGSMSLDSGSDQLAHGLLHRQRGDIGQRAANDLRQFIAMTFHDSGNECFLAREILVERTDTHACLLGDPVGARLIEPVRDKNASSCFDQRVDGRARSLLSGVFPWFGGRFPRHFLRSPMRVGKYELALVLCIWSVDLAKPAG